MDQKQTISALVGAIIALGLKTLYDIISEHLKRKTTRRTIKTHIRKIVLPKLQRLYDDYELAIRRMSVSDAQAWQKGALTKYDDLPMLTSNMFKSIPATHVHAAFKSRGSDAELFDAFYSIDFIRDHLPRLVMDEFQERSSAHKNEKIAKGEMSLADWDAHQFSCISLIELREYYLNRLVTHRTTVVDLMKQFEAIVS